MTSNVADGKRLGTANMSSSAAIGREGRLTRSRSAAQENSTQNGTKECKPLVSRTKMRPAEQPTRKTHHRADQCMERSTNPGTDENPWERRLVQMIALAFVPVWVRAKNQGRHPESWSAAYIIYSMFHCFCACLQHHGGGGQGQDAGAGVEAGTNARGSAGRRSGSSQPLKRCGDDKKGTSRGGGGGGSGRRPGRSSAKTDSSPGNGRWACPIFKSNPIVHYRCNIALGRVSDVRQHLQRRHLQLLVTCPTCYAIFDDDNQRDAHIQERACLPQQNPGWINGEQWNSITLSSGTRAGGNQETRWYIIWDILFPELRRPDSPYCNGSFEDLLLPFISLLHDSGLVHRLWSSSPFSPGPEGVIQLLHTFNHFVPHMRRLASRPDYTPPLSAPPPSPPSVTEAATSAQNVQIPGLVLGQLAPIISATPTQLGPFPETPPDRVTMTEPVPTPPTEPVSPSTELTPRPLVEFLTWQPNADSVPPLSDELLAQLQADQQLDQSTIHPPDQWSWNR